MQAKIIKPHGMSSDKAYRVKTRGNRKEEFLQHYHKRSNVETTFHMIKSKLGDSLKSKNEIAQKNELLCKIIAHNIIVLNQETNEINLRA